MTLNRSWWRAVLTLALVALGGGCTHWVVIRSVPPGAKAKIDGEPMGETPFFFEETTGWSKVYRLELEKEGYEPFIQTLHQDDLKLRYACPAVCLAPLTLGLSCTGCLFSYGLEDEYVFVLAPLDGLPPTPPGGTQGPEEAPSPPGDVPPRAPEVKKEEETEVVPF
ncbi:MAG: PEGA domain-containing protein [Myxococcota bacterium]